MKGRDFIIVKQPRPDEDGLVATDGLDSIAVELQILSHIKIQQHDNIIRLLGVLHHNLGDDESPHILPALVLEYAEFGDLQSFQARGMGNDIQSKYDMCKDAAMGLRCLHENGVIHGDVKGANMLVCKHASRPFIVKLSDFGFAIASNADGTPYLTGYTPEFAAPEIDFPLERTLLQQLDIYSYGIFLHAVLKGGRSFQESFAHEPGSEERLQRYKTMNMLPDLLQLNLLASMGQVKCLLFFFCKILAYCTQVDPLQRFGGVDDILAMLRWANPRDLDLVANQEAELYQVVRLPASFMEISQRRVTDSFEACLVQATHLQRSPMKELLDHLYRDRFIEERDMLQSRPRTASDTHYDVCKGIQLCLWRFGIALAPYTRNPRPTSKLHVDPSENEVPVRIATEITPDLWQHCGVIMKMPKVVQKFIALELMEAGHDQNLHHRRRTTALYNLSCCHVDGIGLPVNVDKGLDLLCESARLGSHHARQQVLRLCEVDATWRNRMLVEACNWPETAETYSSRLLTRMKQIQDDATAQRLRDQWNIDNAIESAHSSAVFMTWRSKFIHLAARVGHIDTISDLSIHDIRLLDARNEYEQTPLIVACQSGNFDVAVKLVELGADVRLGDCDGFTALHWLISFIDADVLLLANVLIAEGANINALGRWPAVPSGLKPNIRGAPHHTGGTPLHWAIAHRNFDVIDVLLTMDADTLIRHDAGYKSPYEMACSVCEPEVIRRIVARFSPTDDANMYYPLDLDYQVVVNGLFWVVAGASRVSRLTALGTSFEQKTKESIRLLVNAGVACDAVLVCGSLKMTATFAIAYHQCNADLLRSGLEYGLEKHLDSTFADASSGGPAMSLAIAHKDREIFACLLDAGASVNWKNRYAQDALGLVAKETDDIWFAERLIHKGADVNSGPHWPFYSAVYCGNLRMARYLWDLGARRECRDQGGVTVLGRLITMRTRAACDRITFILDLADRDEGSGFEVMHSPDALQHRSSALHLAVSPLHTGETFVEDPEMEERCRLTMATLLGKYSAPEYLDSTCGPHHDVPLGMAVEIGNHHAVRMLLEAGANPNAKDEYGRTPMDKNNCRLCFPTSIDVISSVSPEDTLVLAERLQFVNNNTLEIRSLLTSYEAKMNVFQFPTWYNENPGVRSLEWVTTLLRRRKDQPQGDSTTPSWVGMPIEIPERPMQFEAQRLAAEQRRLRQPG
nr:hypothetical protein B0A51_10706 [Rachicladosporium sp. CCFEE 5018]